MQEEGHCTDQLVLILGGSPQMDYTICRVGEAELEITPLSELTIVTLIAQ